MAAASWCLLSACGLGLYLPRGFVEAQQSCDDIMLSSSDHLGNTKLHAETPLGPDSFPCRAEVTGQAGRVVALKLSNIHPGNILHLQC